VPNFVLVLGNPQKSGILYNTTSTNSHSKPWTTDFPLDLLCSHLFCKICSIPWH